MVTSTMTQSGWIDYETAMKIKQMDPGRAEAYKKQKWDEYQTNRVSNAIAQYQQEYADNVTQDPDNAPHYAHVLRTRITEIPMIDKIPQFVELYQNAKNQLTVLGSQEKALKAATADLPADQPGMEDLGSDEPDIQTVVPPSDPEEVAPELTQEEAEAAERAAMDAKIEGTDPIETPAAGTTAEDVVGKYIEKFGEEKYKKLPPKYKNDMVWMAGKL